MPGVPWSRDRTLLLVPLNSVSFAQTPSSLPRFLWMASLSSSLSTTLHMPARNGQHLLSHKLSNIDSRDKNRKSNNQQHAETQLTSGKRKLCLFEKEMLQGMCGKKDKSSCGQRMPYDCPGRFSLPFISPQINCIPAFRKEWPSWQKKKLMQLKQQGSMTTAPMLCGKLALQERYALLCRESPWRSNSQIPQARRPKMTTEIRSDPASQTIISTL